MVSHGWGTDDAPMSLDPYTNRMVPRKCTTKQMGDACEMLIAAEMTLAGMPALKVPDNWPHYDVVAQPPDGKAAQRVSVKSRIFKTGGSDFVEYRDSDEFDWLAIVLIGDAPRNRRYFIVHREDARRLSKASGKDTKIAGIRYWRQDEVPIKLAAYENNFCLEREGAK